MRLDKKRWHCRLLGHHWLFHPQFDTAFYGFKPYWCWYCGEYRDRNKKRIPRDNTTDRTLSASEVEIHLCNAPHPEDCTKLDHPEM